MEFEWDGSKAAVNRRKHKVSFEEATAVFRDPFLATFPDVTHSDAEPRYVSVGTSASGSVLVVVHTDRGGRVRIISCRKATARERKAYEEGNF
jgi:uncharacterized protein